MSKVMTSKVFTEKALKVAKNYKTLYVMGGFGSPLTKSNKKRFINQNDYNKQARRKAKINATDSKTFAFDCSGLIKGILWGWSGSTLKTNGGAKYGSNGVTDINANTMITSKYCTGVSTDFKKIEVGEIVWTTGHVGIYVGNGLVVEATPSWEDKVQITGLKNLGAKEGYNNRTWKKHGKLKYIDYSSSNSSNSNEKVAYYKKYTGSSKSLVDALKLLKIDSSYANRKKIAKKNGISLYVGTSSQNIKLLNLLKEGKLIKP